MNNRIIKFRVWDIKDKEYFTSIDLYNNFYLPFSNVSKRLIFQQFTGLLDNHKQEIYEGDIVILTYDAEGREPMSPTHKEDSEAMEVFWDFDWNAFRVRYKPYYNRTSYSTNCLPPKYRSELEVKIIGNIFENPELLK